MKTMWERVGVGVLLCMAGPGAQADDLVEPLPPLREQAPLPFAAKPAVPRDVDDLAAADASDEGACCSLVDEGNTSPSPFSLQAWLGCDGEDYFLSGHVQQGVNGNWRHPFNPPGGFGNSPAAGVVYRTGYLLNQVYLAMGKVADTSNQPLALGYEVDLVYGSDYVFLQSRGLERELDGTNRWNEETGSGFLGRGRYGLAMPQLFVEVAYGNLSVKVGHFYNILGHEELIPTENFFYTSNYPLFFNGFGESIPVTGAFAQWRPCEQWCLGGGVHRGQANWEDNNDNLNAIGMIEWCGHEKQKYLTFTFDVGAEDDLGANTVYAQSLIFEWQFREKWGYVLNSWYGFEENAAADGDTASWYGFAQYLAHSLSDELCVGVRYDFFDDVDGTRVFPRAGLPNAAPGMYHALSLGANYKPCPNMTWRPEVRWDWFAPDGPLPPGPFDNLTKRSQFLVAIDMLVTF